MSNGDQQGQDAYDRPRTYLFPSKRDPEQFYRTTLHENGAITCNCPARVECWHIRRVREGGIVGRTDDPVSREDRREILQLLSEGNDVGARAKTLALFPSMTETEMEKLLQEIFEKGIEDYYEESGIDFAGGGPDGNE